MNFNYILAIAFLVCHSCQTEQNESVKDWINDNIEKWENITKKEIQKHPCIQSETIEKAIDCIQKSPNWIKAIRFDEQDNENCCAVKAFRVCVKSAIRKNCREANNPITYLIVMNWSHSITKKTCPEVNHGYVRCFYQENKLSIESVTVIFFLVGICCIGGLFKCYCHFTQTSFLSRKYKYLSQIKFIDKSNYRY